MDNKLLKKLITDNKRVVIPDFGAFIKKETEGAEELVFSPFLRKDDGTLTDAVGREYGVDTPDAQAMVSEYVTFLKQSLASTGKFQLEGIGLLTTDANGTINLKDEPVFAEEIPTELAAQPEPATRPQTIQVQGTPATPPPTSHRPVPSPEQAPPASARPETTAVLPDNRIAGHSATAPAAPPIPPPLHQPTQRVYSGFPTNQPPKPNRPAAPATQSAPAAPVQQRPTVGPPPPGHQAPPSQRPANQNARSAPRPGMMRRKPRKKQTDMWLIVAIIAAVIVLGLLIYGFMVLPDPSVDMDSFNVIETFQESPVGDLNE